MERISTHHFMVLGAAVLLGGTFLDVARIVTVASGRDGWMVVLPGSVVGIPYALMLLSLLKQYPQKNLLQISEILFGKWAGKAVGLIYMVLAIYYGGLLLAILGNMFRSIMSLTPLWVFFLGGLAVTLYLHNSGIEVFARFSEIVFPIIVIALLVNVLIVLPWIEPGALLPVLSEGIGPLLPGVLKVMPFAMSYILFLAGLMAFLPVGRQDFKQLNTGIWRGVFLVGIINMLVVMAQILVFGPSETIRLENGILVLEKAILVSRTVAGVESLFVGVWLGAMIIKVTASLFMASWGIEAVFRVKAFKWNLLIGAAILGIALAFTSGAKMSLAISQAQIYLLLPFGLIWIPVLWGAARWKKGAGAL